MTDVEPAEGWMAELSVKGRETADAVALQIERHDLDGVVMGWASSVRTIVGGQNEDYYDDYYIYLCWRESIDQIVAALSEHDASIVLKAVASADKLFRDNTFDDGGEAMSRMFSRIRKEGQWYWRRVPLRGPITRSLGIVER